MRKQYKQRFTGNMEKGIHWKFWSATGEVLCGEPSWKRKNTGMDPSVPGDESDKAIPIARVYGAKNYTMDIRFVEYRESEANARLIEQAPALWSVLVYLYESGMIDNDPDTKKEVESILDMIHGDDEDWDSDE